MNTQPHSKLPRGRTPFDIFFGRSPRWVGYVPLSTRANVTIDMVPDEENITRPRAPMEDFYYEENILEEAIDGGLFREPDVESRISPSLIAPRLLNLPPAVDSNKLTAVELEVQH
jgi:hypothetical protein